ncbi:MAG: TonB-dependent receptor [Chitinophagaceae bacterium]|nr:MAG: TonB-dependent receptor [Chitinophagaceae bacterium]
MKKTIINFVRNKKFIDMKNMLCVITGFFFLLFSFSMNVSAENTLNILAKDKSSGETLAGVSVMVKETRLVGSTDLNGKLKLFFPEEAEYTLQFTYVGYVPQEFKVTIPYDKEVLTIALMPGEIGLDQVFISASPTGTGFQFQAAEVLSGEKLQRNTNVSLGMALDGMAGISMRSFGVVNARPVIRGFDGDRVLVLENGERMGDLSATAHDHAVTLDPMAMERIEIIRGPAGLLYGSNALGGIVNMISADIPQNWKPGTGGKLRLQGATVNNMFGGMGRFNYGWDNAAITGRIGYRSAGEMNTPEGRLPGTELVQYEGALGAGFRGKNSSTGLSFSATDMVYGLPEAIDDPDESVEIRLNRQALQGKTVFRTNSFIENIEFRIHASRFYQEEIEMEIEPDGSLDEDVELEFEQLSLSSSLILQHKPYWIFDQGAIGLNVYGRTMEIGGDEAFSPGDGNMNVALFTFQEIPLFPTFRLQFGGRLEYNFLRTRPNRDIFPDMPVFERSMLNYSASAGFNFKPLRGLEIGGQFARSFRNPTTEELFSDGAHIGAGAYEIGNPDLEVESSLGSDLFIKWNYSLLSLEFAVFSNTIENFITYQPSGEIDSGSGLPIFIYESNRANLSGGEFQVLLNMTENLYANFVADYVRGRSGKEFEKNLPFIPPFRFGGELGFDNNRFYASVALRYVASQMETAPLEEPSGEYFLLGLNAGYRLDFHGRHLFFVRAENLLNESYRDHLTRVTERNNPMPGRNFLLGYNFSF